jgi:hypothetical protein
MGQRCRDALQAPQGVGGARKGKAAAAARAGGGATAGALLVGLALRPARQGHAADLRTTGGMGAALGAKLASGCSSDSHRRARVQWGRN